MIVESLVGLSLVLNVSLDRQTAVAAVPVVVPELSIRQKEAALLPLVRRATACIVLKVSSDPRYADTVRAVDMNDLIIDSIPSCASAVRAMMDAHDQLYGSGSGEAFLFGPYLDVLPSAVIKQVKSP